METPPSWNPSPVQGQDTERFPGVPTSGKFRWELWTACGDEEHLEKREQEHDNMVQTYHTI